jgi:hypothetical protein
VFDDFRIYNRSLSSNEVYDIYNSTGTDEDYGLTGNSTNKITQLTATSCQQDTLLTSTVGDNVYLECKGKANNTINASFTNVGYDSDSIPSDVICFQEYANQSNSCGGLGTGTYNFNNVFNNGIWGVADGITGSQANNLYINYTIPSNIVSAVLKLGVVYSFPTRLVNTSISIPSSCMNTNVSLKILYLFNSSTNLWNNYLYCYNSTDWYLLFRDSILGLSEEGMNWTTNNGTMCPSGLTCSITGTQYIPSINALSTGEDNDYGIKASATNKIVSAEGSSWTQDVTQTSEAGALVYIKGKGRATDTLGYGWTNVAFDNGDVTGMTRTGSWTCSVTGTQYIPSIPASGTGEDDDYSVNCNKNNVITALTGQEFKQDTSKVTYAGGLTNIEGKSNYSNSDTLNYVNVLNDITSYSGILNRTGWTNCSYNISRTDTLNYQASSTNVTTNYPIQCSKNNTITKNESLIINATIYLDTDVYWNNTINVTNTDTLNYTNINVTQDSIPSDGTITTASSGIVNLNASQSTIFNVTFTTPKVDRIIGSAIQGSAEIGRPVNWSKGFTWTNRANRNYNVPLIGYIEISTDTITGTVNLTKSGIVVNPSSINYTTGIVYHNESSINANASIIFIITYNTTAPYINTTIVETSNNWDKYVNLTGPSTAYDSVKTYTSITETLSSVQLFKKIAGVWTDITTNSDYSMLTEDTDGNGKVDKITWYDDTASTIEYKISGVKGDPILVQCIDGSVWTNCTISDVNSCPKRHVLTETHAGEAIYWRMECRYYNPNEFSKYLNEKVRVVQEATSILYDGTGEELLWDLYGPYIGIENEEINAVAYNYHNITFYTPPIFTIKIFNYPEEYYVGEKANASIQLTLNNYGSENITVPLKDYISIRHGINVKLLDNNTKLLKFYGDQDGTIEFNLGTIKTGETKDYSITYDILTAKSELIKKYVTFNQTDITVREYDVISEAVIVLEPLIFDIEGIVNEDIISVDKVTDAGNIPLEYRQSGNHVIVDMNGLDVGEIAKVRLITKEQINVIERTQLVADPIIQFLVKLFQTIWCFFGFCKV